jgi:hypothetical protein
LDGFVVVVLVDFMLLPIMVVVGKELVEEE